MREHVPLEVRHEPVRDKLAQPVLAARRARRAVQPSGCRAREAVDRVHELRHPPAARRNRLHDRRPPFPGAVGLQRQVPLDRRHEPIGPFAIGLVHHEDVGDLHDAGLERLHIVAGAGHQRHDRHVGRADDVHFVLSDADGLDDDDVLARRIEHEGGVAGRRARARRGDRAWPCCG